MAGLLSEANLKFAGILVTAIIGIGGILFNLYEMQRNMALEARRPFLEKQLAVCFEATNAVAAIAGGVQPADAPESPEATFRRLYLGQLALVEDDRVACAMTRFARAFQAELDPKADLGASTIAGCPAEAPSLQQAALNVAQACRELILTSWGAELPADVRGQPER